MLGGRRSLVVGHWQNPFNTKDTEDPEDGVVDKNLG